MSSSACLSSFRHWRFVKLGGGSDPPPPPFGTPIVFLVLLLCVGCTERLAEPSPVCAVAVKAAHKAQNDFDYAPDSLNYQARFRAVMQALKAPRSCSREYTAYIERIRLNSFVAVDSHDVVLRTVDDLIMRVPPEPKVANDFSAEVPYRPAEYVARLEVMRARALLQSGDTLSSSGAYGRINPDLLQPLGQIHLAIYSGEAALALGRHQQAEEQWEGALSRLKAFERQSPMQNVYRNTLRAAVLRKLARLYEANTDYEFSVVRRTETKPASLLPEIILGDWRMWALGTLTGVTLLLLLWLAQLRYLGRDPPKKKRGLNF